MNGADIDDMIEVQLRRRGISDPSVLRAMRDTPRELFVPIELKKYAYFDCPLPIGRGQTISQPYIVAYMAEALEIEKTMTILEIGSGCGYNTAVLSHLARHVYSTEIIERLAKTANKNLKTLNIDNIDIFFKDGAKGLAEHAPFDRIVSTAASEAVPAVLKKQLKIGGILLAPIGTNNQYLVKLKKKGNNSFEEETLLPVRFVPLTGSIQNQLHT